MLSIRNLTAGYSGREVLKEVSFTLTPGELAGVVGPNASGKTTLVKCIGNLMPFKGECLAFGKSVKKLSEREKAEIFAYIPQRSGLGISLSVRDVVLMGFNHRLGFLAQPDVSMEKAAEEAVSKVGLRAYLQADFQTLSEGQKQLVILARAFLMDSNILLLDEPESALDFSHRVSFMKQLSSWVKGTLAEDCDAVQCETGIKKTVSVSPADNRTERAALIVIHDINLALSFCDRLIVLENGRMAGNLELKHTSKEELEAGLRRVYGNVRIETVVNDSGRSMRTMISNE